MRTIDLNADLGEGMPGEREILHLITTASIAGGGHAGGGDVLAESVALAVALNVAVGAHPSYPDQENFGRHSLLGVIEEADLLRSLIDQIVAVASALPTAALHHVKPHGALYNDAIVNERAAEIVLNSIEGAEIALGITGVPVMTMDHGVLAARARAMGRQVISEVFADRAYTQTGELVPRSRSGAILERGEEIVDRILAFLSTGRMPTVDGASVAIRGESICIHGDNAHAVEAAHALRQALTDAGYTIRSA